MSSIDSAFADQEIAHAEQDILEAKKRLVELRRNRPKEPVRDFELSDLDGKPVKLSSLFGNNDDLILIHNMGKACAYCTLWADGFIGLSGHLENRSAFALVSHDSPQTAAEFSKSRGWNFRVLSGHDSDFTKEMGFADPENNSPWPGVSTFSRKPDGSIVRIAKTSFGPGDDFCSVWHILDLLADGPNSWEPKYSYKS